MNRRLVLPNSIRVRIIEHAFAERPLECVGLLAGTEDVVERDYRLVNEARSSTRYFAAECLFQPFRNMREAGLELLGIYHSHPNAPAAPSRHDREENFYPETIHVIVSLLNDEPVLKAWLLSPEDAREIEMTPRLPESSFEAKKT